MRTRGKQALSGLALAIAVLVIPLIPCLACLTARAPVPPDCGRTSCHAVLSPSRQPGSFPPLADAGIRRTESVASGPACLSGPRCWSAMNPGAAGPLNPPELAAAVLAPARPRDVPAQPARTRAGTGPADCGAWRPSLNQLP
jgi:hypothetical protein